MAKDVGTAIHKFKVAVVVSFLPCLVTFLGFHPTWFFIFFTMFFCNLFLLVVWGETFLADVLS